MVRQVETAAIKKAGDNRNAPFERKLTALYTRATLEAGELAGMADPGPEDDDGDDEQQQQQQQREAVAAVDTGQADPQPAPQLRARRHQQPQAVAPSSYLVCCVEEGVKPGGGAPRAVDVGLVAVEPSTGAVMYAQFR